MSTACQHGQHASIDVHASVQSTRGCGSARWMAMLCAGLDGSQMRLQHRSVGHHLTAWRSIASWVQISVGSMVHPLLDSIIFYHILSYSIQHI